MGTPQKILTATLWALLIAVLAGVIGVGVWQRVHRAQAANAATDATPASDKTGADRLPVLWDVPAFSLTDQEGRTVTNADLRGHTWVASFIFTHCSGPCPMISQKMARLQKNITDPSVRLVSFTVDPERDTPDTLKKYAAGFNADPERWKFLTGTVPQMDAVTSGMKIAAQRQPGEEQVVHGTYLLLVDPAGHVRAKYGGQDMSSEDLKQLADDAQRLAREKAL